MLSRWISSHKPLQYKYAYLEKPGNRLFSIPYHSPELIHWLDNGDESLKY